MNGTTANALISKNISLTAGFIFMFTIKKMFYHLHPLHMGDLWECLILCSQKLIKQVQRASNEIARCVDNERLSSTTSSKKSKNKSDSKSMETVWKEVNMDSLIIALVILVEIFAYGITNANGRAVSDYALKKTVGLSNKIIVVVLDLCQVCIFPVFSRDTNRFII